MKGSMDPGRSWMPQARRSSMMMCPGIFTGMAPCLSVTMQFGLEVPLHFKRLRGCVLRYNGEGRTGSQWTAAGN
eukprot:6265394-Ditylum_brightwellii.AAC.1